MRYTLSTTLLSIFFVAIAYSQDRIGNVDLRIAQEVPLEDTASAFTLRGQTRAQLHQWEEVRYGIMTMREYKQRYLKQYQVTYVESLEYPNPILLDKGTTLDEIRIQIPERQKMYVVYVDSKQGNYAIPMYFDKPNLNVKIYHAIKR